MTFALRFETRPHGDGDTAPPPRRLRVTHVGDPDNALDDRPTDTALAERIRAGDADALSALMRRYYAALVRFVARYVGEQDIAEDVVQDVFVRLWSMRAA